MPSWFYSIKDILECLSYLVTIIGIIAIAISVKEFNKNSEREKKQDEQLLIQNSIEVLKKFAEVIIPEIEKAENQLIDEKVRQEKKALEDINKFLPSDKKLHNLPPSSKLEQQIEFNSKSICNYGKIFNQLEQVTVYMNYDMVKDDLVYLPTHKVFIDFVGNNIDYLNYLRSQDAPYANVITLYNSWNDKQKIEELENKQKEIEKKLRRIKNIDSD